MGADVSMRVRNELSEIDRLSRVVADFGARHRLTEKVLFAVNLALEEILVNTIRYGYRERRDREISVRITLEGGELTLELEDDADAFDPTELPPPDTRAPIDERGIGGLGIHLVRGLFDVLEYRRVDGRNRLRMMKRTSTA